MNHLLISLLLAASPATAATDFGKVPTVVCPTWQDITDSAQTCAKNDAFLKATRGCLAKIENLEKTLARPVQTIADVATQSQSKDIRDAQRGYDYTDEAIAHILAVARVGYAQVQEYSLYVLPPSDDDAPEDYDDMSWMDKVECYGGNMKGLEELQREFAAKIARLEARQVQAKQYNEVLKGSGTDMGSLNQVPESAPAPGRKAALPNGNDRRGHSDISGTEKVKKPGAK